jgi:transposase
MAKFDAVLESAQAMVAAGKTESGFGLVRAAYRATVEESLQQRDVSRRFARMLFGPRSERLDPGELKQLYLAFSGEEPVFDAAIAKGETPTIPTPEPPTESAEGTTAPSPLADAPAKPSKKKRPNHHGRAPIVASCAIVEKRVSVPDSERPCAICGKDKGCISHVRHERIDYEPPRLVRHVEVREVLSCGDCRKDVVTAPRSEPTASRRRVGNGIVADLIVEKCSEAQPLNRERERYRRLGWDAPASTIDGAFRWGAELLEPVADVVRGELLADDYVRADRVGITA